MIPDAIHESAKELSKPRASGDDPSVGCFLIGIS